MEFSGVVSWVRNGVTRAVQTKGDRRWSGCTDGGQSEGALVAADPWWSIRVR